MGRAVFPPFYLTWGQTMVEIMKIMLTSFKRSHAHTATQCPQRCSRPHWPTPLVETPGHSWATLGKSHGVIAPIAWVLVHRKFTSWSEPVNSQSCFCWLYRASPSMAAKNIINLILVLTIWWCPCVECVSGRGCLLWPVHSLGKTLLAFAFLHSVLQGQIYLLLQVSLDFLLLHPSPL